MAKKKQHWFKTAMAVIGGLAVVAGIVFSVMWFVPGIHDQVWTPSDTQQTEQEQQPENSN